MSQKEEKIMDYEDGPLMADHLVQLDLNNKIENITNTGSFQWDLNKDHFYCSNNFFAITEIGGHDSKNKLSTQFFFSLIDPEKRNYILEVMHECVTVNQEFEVTFQLTIGERRMIRMHGFPEGNVKRRLLTGFIVDASSEIMVDQQILKGQDAERKRISMELHDSVGQKCIAIKYMLTLMQMKNDFTGFDSVSKSIDEIINEIRSITHNLSTEIVPEVGLKNAIHQIQQECAAALNATFDYQYQLPKGYELPIDVSKMIYRIVQEAYSNIMKHSKATFIKTMIKHQNRQILLTVEDNGQGFDDSGKTFGIGIQNIKKRVSYLNGFINIRSEVGSGTTIKIKIPT
ncbi:MAG: sensor histidine kinase [Bacteroidota bacterium]